MYDNVDQNGKFGKTVHWITCLAIKRRPPVLPARLLDGSLVAQLSQRKGRWSRLSKSAFWLQPTCTASFQVWLSESVDAKISVWRQDNASSSTVPSGGGPVLSVLGMHRKVPEERKKTAGADRAYTSPSRPLGKRKVSEPLPSSADRREIRHVYHAYRPPPVGGLFDWLRVGEGDRVAILRVHPRMFFARVVELGDHPPPLATLGDEAYVHVWQLNPGLPPTHPQFDELTQLLVEGEPEPDRWHQLAQLTGVPMRASTEPACEPAESDESGSESDSSSNDESEQVPALVVSPPRRSARLGGRRVTFQQLSDSSDDEDNEWTAMQITAPAGRFGLVPTTSNGVCPQATSSLFKMPAWDGGAGDKHHVLSLSTSIQLFASDARQSVTDKGGNVSKGQLETPECSDLQEYVCSENP